MKRKKIIAQITLALFVTSLIPAKLVFAEEGNNVNSNISIEAKNTNEVANVADVEDDFVVNIPDPEFKKALNRHLKSSDLNADITAGQLKSITTFAADGDEYDIYDITGAEYLVNAEYIRITYSKITNVDPLKNLTKLKRAILYRNFQLVSIEGLRNLENLDEVSLEICSNLKDITPLKNKSKLRVMDIEKVPIRDEYREGYKDTIASLTNIETLYMNFCDITTEDTEMFDNLVNLENLQLWQNNITDTKFLEKHKNLIQLAIGGNEFSDTTYLEQLTKLKKLQFGTTGIYDFTFLSKLPYLEEIGYRVADERGFTNFMEEINVVLKKGETYTIENKVVNQDGTIAKPVESNYYEYNEEDNTITLKNIVSSPIYIEHRVPINCIVDKATGSVLQKINIQVVDLPVITVNPKASEVTEGEKVELSVTAKGGGNLSYKWYKDGVAIEGATTNSYIIEETALSHAGKYKVEVSNEAGTVTSEEIEVKVNKKKISLPEITVNPKASEVTEGEKVELSVTANGEGTLCYKWYKDGVAIEGATTNSYLIEETALSHAGKYKVEVSNEAGTVTSEEIELKVNEKVDDKVDEVVKPEEPKLPQTGQRTYGAFLGVLSILLGFILIRKKETTNK